MKVSGFGWFVRFGLPTVLAVLIGYFLLRAVDIREIPATLGRLSVGSVAIGFGCYCVLVLAKSYRFRALLGLDAGIGSVFPILALHSFWGNILPMRTGDVSYLYLMRRRQGVDAAAGIASLLVASLIDLVLLLLLAVVSGYLLRFRLAGTFSGVVLYVMPMVMVSVLIGCFVFVSVAPGVCRRIAARCAVPVLGLRYRWVVWCVEKGLAVVDALIAFRGGGRFLAVWFYSVVCVVVRFGFQCYLVSAMGVGIGLGEVLFALAFTNVFNLLPVQTVGNFGTTEFPFVWLLMHFGTPLAPATVTGFSLHLLILMYCVPVGVCGFLMRPKKER